MAAVLLLFAAGTTAIYASPVVDEISATEDDETTIYEWETTGTTTYGTNVEKETNTNAIKFSSNYKASENKYLTITGTEGFKAGDIITLTGYANKAGQAGVEVHTTPTADAVVSTTTFAKESATYTVTLTEDATSLYLGRFGGTTVYLSVLKVTRAASSGKTQLVAAFASTATTLYKSSEAQTVTLPALTVKAGTSDVESSAYSVAYSSNNTTLASVNNGSVTIAADQTGTAVITATVTPANSDTYTGATAAYRINVREVTPLVVAVSDVSANTIDQTLMQPTIHVYDASNNLLTLGTDYTLTVTKASGGSEAISWNDTDNQITVTGSAGAWSEGSATFTVTATPTTTLKGYSAGSDNFTYDVVKGKITPYFLPLFGRSDFSIRVKAGETATTTVPVLYGGEDISDLFTYTYTITTSGASSTATTDGKYIKFTANASDNNVSVKVSATVNADYADIYNAPAELTFNVAVGTDYVVPTVTLDPATVNMYVGGTQEASSVTVANGSTTLTSGYVVKWVSFSPNVATVDENTGVIHGISEGTAQIHAVVLGDNLQSTTAVVTVNVDDPNTFRVEADKTYTRNQSLWNEAHTMRVTLGGWMFPNNVKPTLGSTKTSTDETLKNVSSDEFGKEDWGKTEKAKWKLAGFDYYVIGTGNKNPRQENGSNAQPGSTYLYKATTQDGSVGKLVDPMFNVPCNGSYLVFASIKPGTVTAHIFQNGVFDASGNSKGYRPQRRVFVMDEAGNIVPTTAHIGSTTGKPTGGEYTLSNYSWDLGTMPTSIDEVKKHFVGLTDLTLSKDEFVNGVYESNLDYNTCRNEVLLNDELKDVTGKGYRGWAVLADAPVTYTFDTKPGKTYYLYNFGSKINLYGFSFAENTAAVQDAAVEYKDDGTATITASEAGHYTSASIDRTFKGGVWNAAVLPFSMTMQQVNEIFGTTYSKNNPEGTQIIYFDRIEKDRIYFVRHAYNTLVAGKPFLIKPSKSGDIKINTADVSEFPYVTIEKTTPDSWVSDEGFEWVSSFGKQTINPGDYYISGKGNVSRRTNGSVELKGFRGFLKAQTAEAKQMVLLIGNDDYTNDGSETTGIMALEMDANGNYVERPLSGHVYNVNGQMVATDASAWSTLPNGLYIINGKKYVK